MNTLARLQHAFHAHLLDAPSEIAADLTPGSRLAVYHHAYRVRLVENLADTYEKTCAYIGETHFDASARAFIASHPPRAPSLRDYGAELPGFLAARYPTEPDIAELARFDWAMRHAFDSADAAPLAAAMLADVTASAWETLGFAFVPSLTLLPIRHNTPAVWGALDRDETPPAAERLPQPATALVWRRGWQPHFRTLAPDEARALAGLADGASFAQVCVDAGTRVSANADANTDAAPQLALALRRWFDDEMIAALVARD